jgi:glycosyltransferase involved in cell wall biosynthesis
VRLLAMAHAYPPAHNAGAEMTMHVILRHLVSRGHDVHVLLNRPMPGAPVDYTLDGVQVHVHRSSNDPMPWFLSKPPDKADLVIAHLENMLRAAALCDIHGVPLTHLVHNTHEFTKGAFRRGPCNLAIFNTHWMHDEFAVYWRAMSRAPMPRSVVIHPPVIPEEYATKHGQRITLINLNEDKGAGLFWRLAEAMPDRQFLAVNGAYGVQIVPEDIPANVKWMGHRTPAEMREFVYANTKVLLMPSIYESYGRTAIEAACSGIPTIAHPTPGLKEALGSAGTFVDRDDLDGWVAAIKYLTSPRGFNTASQRARALAESLTPEVDLDRCADAMEGAVRRGLALAR